ncbi:MAG: FAD-dependent oxidoreductase, partial [Burkholderiales bacterium]|nr:FAD-dependent oxidoreductase [Burkholderiales bacterium]
HERQARKETVQVALQQAPGAEEKRFTVQPGQTVLAVAEQSGLAIEAGCRMGICGADPVAVLEGLEHLSPCGDDERATLERLGLAANTRMACCARISGPVRISLEPERRAAAPVHAAAARFDAAIRHVVIVGNGIAGVTAAEHVRKLHPQCEIALVGREKFPLYNRMGITRLVYGRSAMQGLYLLPDAWYDEQRIGSWLNTRAERIDLAGRTVALGTGEALPWDRLILATGSASFVPPVAGFGAAGTFVLRDAEDAMRIRAHAQERRARAAVVGGGGLLGIEAAYALLKLGLRVTVLERGRWPLQRQIDERAGTLLRDYLSGLGMQVLVESEIERLEAPDGALKTAVLKDGRVLACDVALLCAGIRPNVELARAAGLAVNRGVVVDAHMRTSAPDVYCVGDAAEFEGQVYGLWPACVEQGAIAAANAMGEARTYAGTTPATILKVVGADLTSIGRTVPGATDQVITYEDAKARRYAKLVVANGRIAGAIMMGFPNESALVTGALKGGTDVSGRLDALRRGEWRVLEQAEG